MNIGAGGILELNIGRVISDQENFIMDEHRTLNFGRSYLEVG